MIKFLTRLTDWILMGGNITYSEAARLYEIKEQRDIISLVSFANVIRDEFAGNRLNFYLNINLKTGECGNDCELCFHPPRYDIDVKESATVKREFAERKTEEVEKLGADIVSITVCGGNSEAATEAFSNIIKKNSSIQIESRPSLGMLYGGIPADYSKFHFENDCGNIENLAGSSDEIEKALYFSERQKFLEPARKRGCKVSSGAAPCAGETHSDILIPAFVLKELGIDLIALNFSSLKKNNRVFHPGEAIKIISIYRFLHPHREIILAGSQWKNFKIIKSLILLSGANGVMAGNFFRPPSKNILEDVKSLADFNLN